MSRGGRWERIAVRLNAILRKVPRERSLDGKTWHAETSARRSLMRYIVGIVGRLIEEEAERARATETSDGGPLLAPTRLTFGGAAVDLSGVKPGDAIDIRVAPSDVRTIPVVRAFGPFDEDRSSTQGPEVGACGWCGKSLPTSGDCPCIPF